MFKPSLETGRVKRSQKNDSHFNTQALSCYRHDLSRQSVFSVCASACVCLCVRRCTSTDWFLSHMWLQRPPRRPPHAHAAVYRSFPTTWLPLKGSLRKCWLKKVLYAELIEELAASWRPSRCSPLIASSGSPSLCATPVKCTKGVLSGVTCWFGLSRKSQMLFLPLRWHQSCGSQLLKSQEMLTINRL